MVITEHIKQLVKELDPIIGYDVYLCDCGNVQDCPPELVEVNLSLMYDQYGFDHDSILECAYGDEVVRLWETLTQLTTPQWQTVPLPGQEPLWELPGE